MPHVTRRLPAQPHLDVPRREARELLDEWRSGTPEAFDRIRSKHPKFGGADRPALMTGPFRLSDAQLVVAREYTYPSWAELKRAINQYPLADALETAIRAGDVPGFQKLVGQHPGLLHVQVRSGHWGPPMSFAANLGRLEIVQAAAAAGARDFQRAFERAVLLGRLDCAEWLLAHGAVVTPGIVMWPCETLNADGMQFLGAHGAPFADAKGNRLAPLAMVLETYSRNPSGKRRMMEILRQQGDPIPDTAMMAFHSGRVDLLRGHLESDPGLVRRTFSYREIYPPELGCHDDGRSGLHGTPIAGGTLLHLAIDSDEAEIFDLLLASGADVNAAAAVDAEGFGGHTPLFQCVVSAAYLCRRQRDAAMVRTLLSRGAIPSIRASLRKFLDWQETPGWHIARQVTALEWAEGFPERAWVSAEAVKLLTPGG